MLCSSKTLAVLLGLTASLLNTSALTIVSYNENDIGLSECSLGLSYRCQDLQTAKRCQAVKECIQMSWENKKLPSDNSAVCATCMKMVQETRDELQNANTQELLRSLLDDACSVHFHNDGIVGECLRQVDMFIVELHIIFASEMDSHSVCSMTWFCNSEILNQLIDDYAVIADASDNSDSCQDCKVFAADLVTTTKSMDRNIFAKKLVSLCDKLSGFIIRKACASGAQRKANALYNYITTKMTPDKFCATASMCVEEVQNRASLSDGHDSPGCDLCLEIASVLKEILAQKEFKADVLNAVLSICSWFGSQKQQCENYVKLYFGFVYEFFIQQLDSPKRFCQIIDICSLETKFSEEVDEEKNILPEINIVEISNELTSSEKEGLGESLVQSDIPEGTANVSETCPHCKTFVIEFIDALKKLGRGPFKDKMMKMCLSYKVPKFVCKRALKSNADKIYDDITTKMTPDDFCGFTTMCSNGFDYDLKKTAVGSPRCAICQGFVTETRDFLALNSIKEAIQDAFLALCPMLGPLEIQCTNIISDKYLGKVYKYAVFAMEPMPVCKFVDFCETSHLDASEEDEQFFDFDFDNANDDYENNIN